MRFALLTPAALLLAACAGTPAAERIGAAEMSLEAGDLDAARRGAEHAIAAHDTAHLTAGELCRLALVYATVGDEADVAMAARCIRRALAKDSAAVDSFIHAMPVEQRPLMTLAVQLCRTASADGLRQYEENDSIPTQQ
jgi:hypothetical protein